MHCGAESGAIYGLVCGTVWCFTGASGGALHIVLLTLCGAVVGYLCDRYLVRRLLSALLMSLFACPPVYLGAWAIRKVGAK